MTEERTNGNGCGEQLPRQVVVRGVDEVELDDLVQVYPGYPYYRCRVRASVTYPGGSSPVGEPVAEIRQNDTALVGDLHMHFENGYWYSNLVSFSADPEVKVKGSVTAMWMIMYDHTKCSLPTDLPNP